MLNITSLKALETANFKLVTVDGKPCIKATTAMAKAYLRLKKLANPVAAHESMNATDVIGTLVDLEASVTKLAAI
jgi:hypothetical protein